MKKFLKQWGVFAAVFFVMLALNSMTGYIADDFGYDLNFATGKRLESLLEIPQSMYAHSTYMNGRVISHGIDQAFMILPKWVFNICNSLVFTLVIYLMYKIGAKKSCEGIFAAVIFMAMWFFCPAFGQVCLWQVGAVNYLWAVLFMLGFIYPYVKLFKGEELKWGIVSRVVFVVFSFFFGMYGEMASFVGMMGAVLLIVLKLAFDREKAGVFYFLPVISATGGFFALLSMPVEMGVKMQSGMTVYSLFKSFLSCTDMLSLFGEPLILVWTVMLSVAICRKSDVKSIILSVVFALLGIVSNYMLTIAAYYPERCLSVMTVTMICACSVIAEDCFFENKTLSVAFVAAFTVLFSFSFIGGVGDVLTTGYEYRMRENYIEEMKDRGESVIYLSPIEAKTKYSPYYKAVDLSEEAYMWPNLAMAMYYEVNGIEKIGN